MDWFAAETARTTAGCAAGLREVTPEAGRHSTWLKKQFECLQGRTFIWTPIALLTGLLAYYGLEVEPSAFITTIMVLLALALLLDATTSRIRASGILFAFMLTGFVLGHVSSLFIATRVLPASTGKVAITGWITDMGSAFGSRRRIVVQVDSIPEVKPEYWPGKVRLSVSAKDLGERARGEYVEFQA